MCTTRVLQSISRGCAYAVWRWWRQQAQGTKQRPIISVRCVMERQECMSRFHSEDQARIRMDGVYPLPINPSDLRKLVVSMAGRRQRPTGNQGTGQQRNLSHFSKAPEASSIMGSGGNVRTRSLTETSLRCSSEKQRCAWPRRARFPTRCITNANNTGSMGRLANGGQHRAHASRAARREGLL